MYDKIKEVLLSDINKEKNEKKHNFKSCEHQDMIKKKKIRNSQYCKKKAETKLKA